MEIRSLLICCLCACAVMFTGCNKKPEGVRVENITFSDCIRGSGDEQFHESASYIYMPKDKTLKIRHEHMFTCCTCLGFEVNVEQTKGLLKIRESEKFNESDPNCKCLRTLEYLVKGVEPGAFVMRIESEWGKVFAFEINLNKRAYGKVTID